MVDGLATDDVDVVYDCIVSEHKGLHEFSYLKLDRWLVHCVTLQTYGQTDRQL